jgi:Lrp/AsnC family transcriptional regulator for asnA, asnC and gidA
MNGDDIDTLDLKILTLLQQDARIPFQEIARELNVSGGTVHVRYNKLKEHEVIKGSRLLIDYGKLGYDVSAFIGVNLHNAGDYRAVLEQLKSMPEITEAHYTTGSYSIFIKVVAKSTRGLHAFLTGKLQTLKEIQSTETFISLDIPVERDVPLV